MTEAIRKSLKLGVTTTDGILIDSVHKLIHLKAEVVLNLSQEQAEAFGYLGNRPRQIRACALKEAMQRQRQWEKDAAERIEAERRVCFLAAFSLHGSAYTPDFD